MHFINYSCIQDYQDISNLDLYGNYYNNILIYKPRLPKLILGITSSYYSLPYITIILTIIITIIQVNIDI